MTLAEIIEEGEDAEQAYRDAKAFTAAEIGAADACHVFYVANGPRLLAVARAAVEWEKTEDEVINCGACGADYADGPTDGCSACALRAAVRGEGKETTNG